MIRNGVVTLMGSVTPDRDKAREIADEIARVRGVQEIRNEIVTLPTSFGDDQIRVALFRRIFGNIHFDRISHANPPFRLVVHHGVVSLYGVVQSQIELPRARVDRPVHQRRPARQQPPEDTYETQAVARLGGEV